MAKGSGSTKGGVDGHSYSKTTTGGTPGVVGASPTAAVSAAPTAAKAAPEPVADLATAPMASVAAPDIEIVKTDEVKGLKPGETLKELKERLGSDIPKSVENLDGAIKGKWKEIKWSKEDSKHIESNLKTLFDNSDFGMNVPFYSSGGKKAGNVVDMIFEQGVFKSQIETGTGMGSISETSRREASKNLFGLPTSSSRESYEKYGFLMDKDILKQAESHIANGYWAGGNGIQIRFKKDRVITTFTTDDSLSEGFSGTLAGSLTSDPKAVSVNYKHMSALKDMKSDIKGMSAIEGKKALFPGSSYIELQYHGKLTTSDIESIYVKKENVKKISDKSYAKMKELGIKVYTTDDSGKLITIND